MAVAVYVQVSVLFIAVLVQGITVHARALVSTVTVLELAMAAMFALTVDVLVWH